MEYEVSRALKPSLSSALVCVLKQRETTGCARWGRNNNYAYFTPGKRIQLDCQTMPDWVWIVWSLFFEQVSIPNCFCSLFWSLLFWSHDHLILDVWAFLNQVINGWILIDLPEFNPPLLHLHGSKPKAMLQFGQSRTIDYYYYILLLYIITTDY